MGLGPRLNALGERPWGSSRFLRSFVGQLFALPVKDAIVDFPGVKRLSRCSLRATANLKKFINHLQNFDRGKRLSRNLREQNSMYQSFRRWMIESEKNLWAQFEKCLFVKSTLISIIGVYGLRCTKAPVIFFVVIMWPPGCLGLATRAGMPSTDLTMGAAWCWGPTQRPRVTVPTHRHSAKNCFKTHRDLFEGKLDKLYRYDSMNTGFWNGCAPARAHQASQATAFVGECSYYYQKQKLLTFCPSQVFAPGVNIFTLHVLY